MAKKVLIPTKLDKAVSDILKRHGFEPLQDAARPIEDLCKANPDAVALIVRSEKVGPAVMDALPALKAVVRAGAGYDTIDVKHARRKGVDVMNTPGANSNAVAEEVVAMILAAYRHIVPGDRTTREGLWEKNAYMGRELSGKTVGIIGLGNIGQLLVKRLAGFECRVLAYDPVVSAARAEEIGVELRSLEDIFAEADIISLHIPETDETRGLVGKDLLARARKGAMVVNCARAGVVDEAALRQAKKDKGIVFCNDVYPKDAAGPKSVADFADIMLPHLGASTVEANETAARRAAEQLVEYFEQGVTRYVVNRGVPEGLDPAYQQLAFALTRAAHAYLGAAAPQRIEATFYGGLKAFESWLLAPIVLGLSAEFDPLFDCMEASKYLEQKGIAFQSRAADDKKGYGNAITIDLLQGAGQDYRRVSVRGTIAEGRPMISRLDGFGQLYVVPQGHNVLVAYKDQPGMLSRITGAFASRKVNIDEIRSSLDRKSGESLAVLKVNQPADKAVLDEILAHPGFRKAVAFTLKD